ncbi:MAG: NAD(P)/FAD-dependent oxidoreductase [Candidatus Thermoplasmatota archaeon]|nr:NAD(P)/FAD-dependent oxidoreductase [Candidatus Thermoplasmatota archaeon]
MSNSCDIAVIGGGVSGAAAALEASKYARVTVIERKPELGSPVKCGECVSEKVLEKYELESSNLRKLNKIKFFVGSKEFVFSLPANFCVVDKSELQKIIIKRALKSDNCSLILGKLVDGLAEDGIKIQGKKIKSKIIIACDGIESKIAKCAGIDTRISSEDVGACIQYLAVTEQEHDSLEVYFDNYPGYAWLFPKTNDIANVGVGVLGNCPKVKETAENFIAKRFGNLRALKVTTGAVPVALPKEVYKNNILLAGDAARLVNPLSGAGIQNALLSGKLAGAIAGRCISEDLPLEYLKNYELICKSKIYPRLKLGYELRKFIASKPLKLARIFALAKFLPKLWLKIFIDTIYYKDINERNPSGKEN